MNTCCTELNQSELNQTQIAHEIGKLELWQLWRFITGVAAAKRKENRTNIFCSIKGITKIQMEILNIGKRGGADVYKLEMKKKKRKKKNRFVFIFCIRLTF